MSESHNEIIVMPYEMNTQPMISSASAQPMSQRAGGTHIVNLFVSEFGLPPVEAEVLNKEQRGKRSIRNVKPEYRNHIITQERFDAWAIKHGLYGRINLNSADELNAARNKLRYRLNNWASHISRKENNEDCFELLVLTSHGTHAKSSYFAFRPEKAMVRRVGHLSNSMRSAHIEMERKIAHFEKLINANEDPIGKLRLDHMKAIFAHNKNVLAPMLVGWENSVNAFDAYYEEGINAPKGITYGAA